MFSKLTVLLLASHVLLSTMMPIVVYNNARFDPIDMRYLLSNLSSISSENACHCQCYDNVICFMGNYFGINQTCLLFFAQLSQGVLRVVPTSVNATVFNFGNRSFGAIQFYQLTEETVYGIYNTTAGGNSIPEVSGETTGTYFPGQSPQYALDGNTSTQNANHGMCNITFYALECGENTGLYVTTDRGPVTVVAFYMGTNLWGPNRDPLTITLEGSNETGSVLTLGSSWNLIYNGSTGLAPDPGRSALGALQMLTNYSTRFASYRLLVTSKRGVETCVAYSELQLAFY